MSDKVILNKKEKRIIIIGALVLILLVAIIVGVILLNRGDSKPSDSSSVDITTYSSEDSTLPNSSSVVSDSSSESTVNNSSQTSEESSSQDDNSSLPDGISITYNTSNSWESGGKTYTQVDLAVSNGSSAISGWELKLNIPNGAEIEQGWNAGYAVSGSVLTVKNEEYNAEIFSGGTVTCGFIIVTNGAFSITSATVNGSTAELKKGTVGGDNNQSNQNGGSSEQFSASVEELLARSNEAVQGDDWLFAKDNKIVDKNGKEVWITGVNWFGYNTGTNTFDGLWNSELVPSVKAIADHGFNLIRIPFSAELINQWASGEYPKANYNNAYNPDLNQMNSLQIFDYVVKLCEENGIKIMIDIHSAETNASGHVVNLWYTDKVTTEQYYSALEWMADRYKNNDTIVAFDLKNEPHGKPYEQNNAAIWNNSKSENNWKYVAETAALKVLNKNPNVLIMVEGIEIYPIDIKTNNFTSTNDKDYYFNWWGGNLRGVADYPIDLGKYQNKLVYSPHDYGPTVYEQPWFEGEYDYDSLMKDCWQDNWFYIYEDKTAPLLIGEWGGFMREPNLKWMTCMRDLIKKYKLHHTFWCFNANSGDTGGLVLDDFKTWDEEKYSFVKEVLWQKNGKFVGLDHAIPLGANGITLADY